MQDFTLFIKIDFDKKTFNFIQYEYF